TVSDVCLYSILLFLLIYLCSSLSFFFFSSRRRHTRSKRDWSSDVCSSDLSSSPPPIYLINPCSVSTCLMGTSNGSEGISLINWDECTNESVSFGKSTKNRS